MGELIDIRPDRGEEPAQSRPRRLDDHVRRDPPAPTERLWREVLGARMREMRRARRLTLVQTSQRTSSSYHSVRQWRSSHGRDGIDGDDCGAGGVRAGPARSLLLVALEELLEVLVAVRSTLLRLPTYEWKKGYAESVAFEVEREGDS